MYEEIERLTRALCAAHGTPGCEEEAYRAAAQALSFCDAVEVDALGGVTGVLGDRNAKRRILLDAHIDQIGLVVTNIDENGFLRVTNVGGVDCRTMPGSTVTVYGRETLTGIVCTLPPHLAKGDGENIPPVPSRPSTSASAARRRRRSSPSATARC